MNQFEQVEVARLRMENAELLRRLFDMARRVVDAEDALASAREENKLLSDAFARSSIALIKCTRDAGLVEIDDAPRGE